MRVDLHKEDAETTKADFRRDPVVNWIVWERRGADKLNHFMRWCHKLTEGMTPEDKLGFVRGLLPSNLIGDHAYSHWEREVRPRYPRFVAAKRRSRQSVTDSAKFRLRRAVDRSRSAGPPQRADQSAQTGRRAPSPPPGMHDIDAFVETIFDRFMTGMIERTALYELIGAIDGKGGHEPPFQFSAITAYLPWPPGVTASNG